MGSWKWFNYYQQNINVSIHLIVERCWERWLFIGAVLFLVEFNFNFIKITKSSLIPQTLRQTFINNYYRLCSCLFLSTILLHRSYFLLIFFLFVIVRIRLHFFCSDFFPEPVDIFLVNTETFFFLLPFSSSKAKLSEIVDIFSLKAKSFLSVFS